MTEGVVDQGTIWCERLMDIPEHWRIWKKGTEWNDLVMTLLVYPEEEGFIDVFNTGSSTWSRVKPEELEDEILWQLVKARAFEQVWDRLVELELLY